MANYDDDIYHPNYQDRTVGYHQDQDADSLYGPSSSDSQSITKKTRKEIEELKAADIGWRKIRISVKNKHNVNGRNLKKDIEYYSTGYNPGTFIRCPISGHRTTFRVGTKDENMFYSVVMATGYNGQKTPDHLYYSSPDEYEKHWNITLNTEEKQRWYTKNLAERVRRS